MADTQSILANGTTNAGQPGTTDKGTASGSIPAPDAKGAAGQDVTTAPDSKAGGNADTGKAAGSETTPKTDEKAKDGEPAAKAAASAEDFALKLPEGWKADETLLTDFKPLAKELGLKGESAQKLADLYVKGLSRLETARQQQELTETTAWIEAAKKDKEIGGDAFKPSVERAFRAIDKFGTPELQSFLESRHGNHPELIRFLARVGKALAEDSVAGTSGSGAGSSGTDEALLRSLYPTMHKEQ